MPARHRLLLRVAATLVGLTACTPTPAPAPPTAAPTTAPTAPTAPPPASPTVSATSSAAATPTSSRTSGGADCPSAKALEKLIDLPKGWHFRASTVECWKGWATADPEGPSVGDGIYLFRYKTGKGWQYHSQGSGYDCKDLGVKESAPFCQYP